MHIIPPGLSPDHRALAAALAAGAGSDPAAQAAIAVLLHIPGPLAAHPGLQQHIVWPPTDRAERLPAMAWPRWRALTGHPQLSHGERAALRVAASLVDEDQVYLGDMLRAVDERMRAVLTAAVAHACGLPEPADGRPGTGDGSVPVPDGVDGHPTGHRCLGCGRRLRHVANPPPYPCTCDAPADGPADLPVPFDAGDGPMVGYVVGHCGHRVAESEWRAGFRVCERCPEGGAR